MCYYKGQRFGHACTRLYDIPYAENVLPSNSTKRNSAEQALHNLKDLKNIFFVPGLKFNHADRRYSVMKLGS